jgi:hypothetical protein
MRIIVASGMVLSLAAGAEGAFFSSSERASLLDNSGTIGNPLGRGFSQSVAFKGLAKGGSFQAERAGFSDGLPAALSRWWQLKEF